MIEAGKLRAIDLGVRRILLDRQELDRVIEAR
jgi:hypothetical protein